MSPKIIQTQNAPAAIGPYSQAVVTGGIPVAAKRLEELMNYNPYE